MKYTRIEPAVYSYINFLMSKNGYLAEQVYVNKFAYVILLSRIW